MASQQEIKDMRKTLDNKILRKQILGLNKKKSVQKIAKNNTEVDKDYDDFQTRFLKNWNKLENVPEVYQDLKELPQEQWDNKKDELKNQFAESLINSDNYKQGYNYANQHKEYWKKKIMNKFNNKK